MDNKYKTNEEKIEYIVDTSCLLNFAKIDVDDRVFRSWKGRFAVGPAVLDQVRRRPKESERGGEPYPLQPYIEGGYIHLIDQPIAQLAPSPVDYYKLSRSIGEADTEVVLLGAANGLIVVTDDFRDIHSQMVRTMFPDLMLMSTLQLLNKLVQEGVVSQQEVDRLRAILGPRHR